MEEFRMADLTVYPISLRALEIPFAILRNFFSTSAGTFSKIAMRGLLFLMKSSDFLMSSPHLLFPVMPYRFPAREKSVHGGVHT